jgi:LysR family glycine cleavage system transcriptional activator
MNWRDIPSLSALRAFEAAARLGNFSAAARELNVTHAAIAQHVRGIEAELNTSLLVRAGRGVALTDAGRQLAAALSDGFGLITDGVRQVAADAASRPITISVTPSFAENWLMPRLAGFWAAYPGEQISISPSTDLVDLRRDSFDMAIRYGNGDWPGIDATQLVAGDFTIVVAPSLLAGRAANSIADVQDLPWIFEAVHHEARKWVTEVGMDMACCQMNEVATLSMLLSAVRAGGGVSVVSSALVADDIASGKLVAVMRDQREGLGYYIAHRPGNLSARAKIFKNWLLAQVA